MQSSRPTRLAADIGGTFTDVVLEARGQRWSAKVLTTPRAPQNGVLASITQMLHARGMGAAIEIEHLEHAPFAIAGATFDRRFNPARGRAGGGHARVGRMLLASGAVLPGKRTYVVLAGDQLIVDVPGGSGYGVASEPPTTANRCVKAKETC